MFEEEKKDLTAFLKEVMPKLDEKAERPHRLIQQVLNHAKDEGPLAAKRFFELILSRSDARIIGGEESGYVESLTKEFSNNHSLENKKNKKEPDDQKKIVLNIPEKTLQALAEIQSFPNDIRKAAVIGIYDEHIQPIAQQKFNEVAEEIFGELELIAGFTNPDRQQS